MARRLAEAPLLAEAFADGELTHGRSSTCDSANCAKIVRFREKGGQHT